MTDIGWRPGAGPAARPEGRPGAVTTPGPVIWLTGPPASGKSTLAEILAVRLAEEGRAVEILDTDVLRKVLTPRPTYGDEERDWFYDVLARLAGLLSGHGITVLVAATAHRRAYRERARLRLPRFAEVYVRCSLEACRRRDPKGLYARARRGGTSTLPGAQEPYEEPRRPEAIVDTESLSPSRAADSVIEQLRRAGLIEPAGAPGRGARAAHSPSPPSL